MKKPLATLGQRILAWIVDLIIIGIIAGILGGLAFGSIFLGALTANPFAAVFGVTTLLVMFIVIFGYTIYFEGTRQGQTVGKMVMKIRVVDDKTRKYITMEQSVIRNILRIIDNQVIGLVGVILIAVTEKKQRLGDILAKTVVVKA
ncbi:MAG: RDD family protein [Candidatus Aenigmarchaeota archaeon]|nr:RDD family protein [Candidatus Aenigmarchaeota archaeon]